MMAITLQRFHRISHVHQHNLSPDSRCADLLWRCLAEQGAAVDFLAHLQTAILQTVDNDAKEEFVNISLVSKTFDTYLPQFGIVGMADAISHFSVTDTEDVSLIYASYWWLSHWFGAWAASKTADCHQQQRSFLFYLQDRHSKWRSTHAEFGIGDSFETFESIEHGFLSTILSTRSDCSQIWRELELWCNFSVNETSELSYEGKNKYLSQNADVAVRMQCYHAFGHGMFGCSSSNRVQLDMQPYSIIELTEILDRGSKYCMLAPTALIKKSCLIGFFHSYFEYLRPGVFEPERCFKSVNASSVQRTCLMSYLDFARPAFLPHNLSGSPLTSMPLSLDGARRLLFGNDRVHYAEALLTWLQGGLRKASSGVPRALQKEMYLRVQSISLP